MEGFQPLPVFLADLGMDSIGVNPQSVIQTIAILAESEAKAATSKT